MRRTSPILPTLCLILTVVAAGAAGATLGADGGERPVEPTPPDRLARAFVVALFDGDVAAAHAVSTETLATALTPTAASQVTGTLTGQLGGVSAIGDAWREGEMSGATLWRVPVEFERGIRDLRVTIDGEGRVAGVFVENHVAPPSEAPPSTAPPVPTPAAAKEGRNERDVLIGTEDRALGGTLTLPDGDGPFPGAILVHGSGPNDRDGTIGPNRPLRDLAWGLAERGVAVLRYDKRTKTRPETLAGVTDLTVEHEVLADARAALRVLAAEPEVDADRVYVVGHSLGATLAPRIAATAEPRPAGAVLLAGAARPLYDLILDQTRYIAGVDGVTSPEEEAGLTALAAQIAALRAALDGEAEAPATTPFGVPFAYWKDLDEHEPTAAAAALGLPLLVVQFGRDYQVTDDDFARWRDALGERESACLVRYPALDHLMRAGEGPSTPASYGQPAPVDAALLDGVAAWIGAGTCPGE